MAQKKTGLAIILLCLAVLGLILGLQAALNISPFNPSAYNTYTHQALAWRAGHAYLSQDIPHLELAIYQGRYYVSFPPVPSLPIYLLTFVFGANVPDGLLVMAYALLATLVLFRYLARRGFAPFAAAGWAFLSLFASSLLPLVLQGAVWYQAQVLGLLLIILALERLDAGQPLMGLICYALSVGCRPFNALYGPLLLYLYARPRLAGGTRPYDLFRQLLPGLTAGLLIAGLYAWYNILRFGNPLEFGHNHLPEFSFQGGQQFALAHLGKNAQQYLLGLPFARSGAGLALKPFGFSLFLANPLLLLLVIWGTALALKGGLNMERGLILLFFALHLLLLLLHRTFGGYQFGARYAVDLLPHALLFLARRARPSCTKVEAAVMLAGLAFSIYGSLMVHI